MGKPSESTKLNPQIAEIEIGVRTLRKIKIFPLAAGPQLQLIDKMGAVASLLMEAKNEQTIGNLLGVIRKEIPEIIAQVIPLGESAANVLNEISMTQMEQLVKLIYDMNFESIVKNLQGLFGQVLEGAELVEELSNRSKSPLPQSVKSTDTN